MPVATTYEDPRAHAVRERYLALFGGVGLPVPVEAIAEDLLGLHIEEAWDIDCSGMLLPAGLGGTLGAETGCRPPLSALAPLERHRPARARPVGSRVLACSCGLVGACTRGARASKSAMMTEVVTALVLAWATVESDQPPGQP